MSPSLSSSSLFFHEVSLFHSMPALCWAKSAPMFLSSRAVHSNSFETLKSYLINWKKHFSFTMFLSCLNMILRLPPILFLIFKNSLSSRVSIEGCLFYRPHPSLKYRFYVNYATATVHPLKTLSNWKLL